MVKCSECSFEVSENVSACPNCGNPLNNPDNVKGDNVLFVLAIIGLVCIAINFILHLVQLFVMSRYNIWLDSFRAIVSSIGSPCMTIALVITVYKNLYRKDKSKKTDYALKISISAILLQIINTLMFVINNIITYVGLTEFRF